MLKLFSTLFYDNGMSFRYEHENSLMSSCLHFISISSTALLEKHSPSLKAHIFHLLTTNKFTQCFTSLTGATKGKGLFIHSDFVNTLYFYEQKYIGYSVGLGTFDTLTEYEAVHSVEFLFPHSNFLFS